MSFYLLAQLGGNYESSEPISMWIVIAAVAAIGIIFYLLSSRTTAKKIAADKEDDKALPEKTPEKLPESKDEMSLAQIKTSKMESEKLSKEELREQRKQRRAKEQTEEALKSEQDEEALKSEQDEKQKDTHSAPLSPVDTVEPIEGKEITILESRDSIPKSGGESINDILNANSPFSFNFEEAMGSISSQELVLPSLGSGLISMSNLSAVPSKDEEIPDSLSSLSSESEKKNLS